jgi:hypothetical protein
MDAGNFPTYEKIINTTALPRTRQEGGWFFLELSFSPQEATRSVTATMHLDFGAFGDVCRLRVERWGRLAAVSALSSLNTLLPRLQPPATSDYDAETDVLTLNLLANSSARQGTVQGSLIFDSKNDLVCLATRLK